MFSTKKDVPSLAIIPYSDPYNVLIFTQNEKSLVWITFADDSSIDGGYSFAFSGKQMAASGTMTSTYGEMGFVSFKNYSCTKLEHLIEKFLSNI